MKPGEETAYRLLAAGILRDDVRRAMERRRRRRMLRQAALVVGLSVALSTMRGCPARAEERDVRVDALAAFVASGEDTPAGGAGVYSDDFGKRIGTVERLGDGSVVMRGDFGRVVAKVEPRRSAEDPLRITVRDRK